MQQVQLENKQLMLLGNHTDQFSLVALSVGRNILISTKNTLLNFLLNLFRTLKKDDAEILQAEFPSITFSYGDEGLIDVAVYDKADILVNAVMGSVGLYPTLQAIEAKKTIAIANKETLVTAGHLVMDAAKKAWSSITSS